MKNLSPFLVNQILSRDELSQIVARSNLRGLATLVWNWGLIVISLALVAHSPNFITITLAVLIVAGRQLGLAILMHDCAHDSLFRSKILNQFVGQWLCAAPLLINLDAYRLYHLKHHQNAGTTEDPDLANYANYPVTKNSFRRKVFRDLSGITGAKNIAIILAMSLGLADYSLAYRKQNNARITVRKVLHGVRTHLLPVIIIHGIALAILSQLRVLPLYALWIVIYLSAYMLVLRIRNIAEHAAVVDPDSKDPRLHTRTTLASWWERLLVAPNFVNYHLEHHLLPAVPGYHLPRLHRILTRKGVIPEESVVHGYRKVLKQLTSRSS